MSLRQLAVDAADAMHGRHTSPLEDRFNPSSLSNHPFPCCICYTASTHDMWACKGKCKFYPEPK